MNWFSIVALRILSIRKEKAIEKSCMICYNIRDFIIKRRFIWREKSLEVV